MFISITKGLAETLRKNRTIDWQKYELVRAKMRMIIKKLLKKYKYPPEGIDDVVQTVITQCELWTVNYDMEEVHKVYSYPMTRNEGIIMVAEKIEKYN